MNVAKEKKTEARVGRPVGSVNREYIDIVVLPPCCPMCDGTEFTDRQQTKRRELSGYIPGDGRLYNLIVWSRARCKGCRQWLAFREYHLIEPGAK